MTNLISHTSVDCSDAFALSEWWRDLLGYEFLPGDPNEPGDTECMIRDPLTHHQLLFIEVDGPPTGPKRIHFDLCPRSGSRDEEVDRLRALGVTETADHRGIHGPGSGWVTFADPEGNQFCIVRSAAERAAQG